MRVIVKNRPACIILIFLGLLTVFYLGRLSNESKECTKFNTALAFNKPLVNHHRPITFLLMLIMSEPEDQLARQTVRETWLRLSAYTDLDARHIFPIGTKNLSEFQMEILKREQEQFHDLVFIDKLIESFDNLAKKTAYSIEKGVEMFEFEYVLKTDSDSFVQVGRLLKALKDIAHKKLYWGFLDGRAKPFRKGKYREKDWVLCDRYLPYQLGGGYVLSYQLASFISDHINLLRYFRAEDVSVGTWLAGIDVKYVHDPRFDTEYISRGCNNNYLITHKHSAQTLNSLANNVRNTGHLCSKEFQSRPSYVYDFSSPPSQCCQRVNGSRIP